MENANFATWTSVLTWFDFSEVKVIPRSLGQDQDHLMENANLATWTSFLTWVNLYEVKVIHLKGHAFERAYQFYGQFLSHC